MARHRSPDVDAAYSAYDRHPLDEPDQWGDLASFRDAAGAPSSDQLRAALLEAVPDDVWEDARNGFGDPDLADQ